MRPRPPGVSSSFRLMSMGIGQLPHFLGGARLSSDGTSVSGRSVTGHASISASPLSLSPQRRGHGSAQPYCHVSIHFHEVPRSCGLSSDTAHFPLVPPADRTWNRFCRSSGPPVNPTTTPKRLSANVPSAGRLAGGRRAARAPCAHHPEALLLLRRDPAPPAHCPTLSATRAPTRRSS